MCRLRPIEPSLRHIHRCFMKSTYFDGSSVDCESELFNTDTQNRDAKHSNLDKSMVLRNRTKILKTSIAILNYKQYIVHRNNITRGLRFWRCNECFKLRPRWSFILVLSSLTSSSSVYIIYDPPFRQNGSILQRVPVGSPSGRALSSSYARPVYVSFSSVTLNFFFFR